MKKVVIIGGMAAGCKTAARLRRLDPDCKITIIEKLPFVSFGTCGMPFYASGDVNSFEDLMKTPWGVVRNSDYFLQAKNIEVLTQHECLAVHPNENRVEIRTPENTTIALDYDYLVIATGSVPAQAPFPVLGSERICFFHSPLDAKKFRTLAERGKIESVIIIGGGFIGCELAESVSTLWGINTTIIEKESHLAPKIFDSDMSRILFDTIARQGISVYTNEQVKKVEENGDSVIIETESNTLQSDYVILALGAKPNVSFLEGSGIAIGNLGGIVVDEHLRTNLENIYAAGDCIEVTHLVTRQKTLCQLGSIANRQGRVIADNIVGFDSKFEGIVGASSFKIFDTIFSSVGITQEFAKRLGVPNLGVCGTFYDRPHYHPENQVLFAKLIYNPTNHKLLGLQMIGKGEVNRYIDSFALMLKHNATVEDLLDFEHSYTPPHSSPINPLNYLGGMVDNIERYNIEIITASEFSSHKFDGIIIDLRQNDEIEQLPLPNSMAIPFEQLRLRIGEVPKNSKILCVCQKGPRALESAITLKQLGLPQVSFLAGGLQMLNSSF